VYKVLLGTASEDDRTNLQNMREAEAVRAEFDALRTAVDTRVAGAVKTEALPLVGKGGPRFDVPTDQVFNWSWPAGGKLDPAPAKPIIDQMVAYYASQQLGQRQVESQRLTLDKDKELIAKLQQQFKDATDKLNAAAASFPKEVAAAQQKADAQAKDARAQFQAATQNYVDEKRKAETMLAEKDIVIRQANEDYAKAKARIESAESQLEAREDPFEFDKPHGRIVRRRGNLVEINLGKADNVKAGLKFSVQPSDTPERGFDTRKRRVRTPDGRTEVQIVAKGKLEVIQTLGDHLSEARLIEENDPVRDGVLTGDLLYNSVWRKGAPDHIALIGIFDLNGDGTDDIKQLARDLTKMGIIVDAYWDLDQNKWVGRISEKTIYAVEGNIPFKEIQAGEPPVIIEAKAGVLNGIGTARKDAKERGTKVVRMRDFFPRIGYPLNLDVDEERINEAAARYLKLGNAEAPPGM
jgi:hypothetical protein